MDDTKKKIMLPWSRACFVCGEENSIGMKARSFISNGWIELPFSAPKEFVGWRSVVHGGLIATVLDEVMTWATIVGSRKPCYAAEIKIRLLKPLAPGTECKAVARMTENRKRIFHAEAFVRDEKEKEYARSEGRYMIVPKDKVQEFMCDFVDAPGCHDIKDVFED